MIAATASGSPPQNPVRTKCVLLIEDNPEDAALVKDALRANRIVNDVVHAKDGAEARDYLFGVGRHEGRDVEDCPQLILLDLKLPKIDGLDLLRRIRAHEATKLVPVVVLTSSDHDADVTRGYGLGANSYVRKPVEFEAFMKAVKELSVYWLVLNEPPPAPQP